MTDIQNGTRGHLVIKEVIDGDCGISRNKVAFVPNRQGRKPADARFGLLNGQPVQFSNMEGAGNERHYVATFEPVR